MNKHFSAGFILKRMFLPVLAGISLVFYRILTPTHYIDDLFTVGFSRLILKPLAALSSLLPVSMAEFMAGILVISLLILVTGQIRAMKLGQNRLKRIFILFDLASFLLIFFLLSWGFNYRQIGISYTLQLRPAVVASRSELEPVVYVLIHQAKQERREAGFDDETPFLFHGDMQKSTLQAYDSLSHEYPQFTEPRGLPKPLISSRWFSRLGITGIFSPFTAEANYNNDQTDLLKPSTMLHELAHLKGVAKEGEANFMAYLSSRYAYDPQVRYSGTMLALTHCINSLRAVDAAAARNALRSVSNGMRNDLYEYDQYWKQFEGELMEKATKVNDGYLKANGQEQGIATYEDMVGFIVAYQSKIK